MENIKPIQSSQLKGIIEMYSPFVKEVKKRLLFTLSAFVVATLVGFFFYENIIKFLISILGLKGINIVFTSPFQFINLAVSCGIATGLIISLPLLIIQIMSFLKPALKDTEYKTITRFLPFSFILFLVGFLAGAYIMKWQIEIFLQTSISIGIGNILDISQLLTTVLLTSTFMGVGFQFPIVLLLLLRMGILKPIQLTSKRKWIYLGSFLFSFLLPADSILADIFLSLPLILLFELTLILNRLMERKKN